MVTELLNLLLLVSSQPKHLHFFCHTWAPRDVLSPSPA